ncbi:hypothetical protein D3C75_651810 [compost metagenome]
MRTACIRNDLIRNGVAHFVLFAGITEQTNGAGVKLLRSFLLGSNIVLIDLHGTGARAARRIWFHFRVKCDELVALAIDVHIKAEVIDVLMGSADNIMVDQRAIFGVVFGGIVVHGFGFHAFYRFNTRRARVNADGAILMEYPVENVIVVTDCANPAHH